MSFYFLSSSIPLRGEADVWRNTPTFRGIILYSIVTPIFCLFGIFGNIVSLMVLKRKELTGSVYTYLAVLACVDLATSIILMLGGISRGVMWKYGWGTYDALISLPLGGFLNTLGVLAIIGLTIDRVIYLWNPVRCAKPIFCHSWVAKRLMIASFLIAVAFNLPYCFIYARTPDGRLTTTKFFDSKFYKAFNWFTLFVFAVAPTVILLLGNGFLIRSLRMAKKVNKKAVKCRTKKCKRRDHTNLTITLIMIIVFFLITNIPESLVSRTAAINLLFKGDHQKANTETLETLRQICIILGAIDVNTNFIFYYTFCPAFCKELKSICKTRRRRSSTNLQVNVFVLSGSKREKCPNKQVQKALEMSRKSIESAFNLNEIHEEYRLMAEYHYNNPENDYFGIFKEEYVPPFSTILEETSTLCTSDKLNKY